MNLCRSGRPTRVQEWLMGLKEVTKHSRGTSKSIVFLGGLPSILNISLQQKKMFATIKTLQMSGDSRFNLQRTQQHSIYLLTLTSLCHSVRYHFKNYICQKCRLLERSKVKTTAEKKEHQVSSQHNIWYILKNNIMPPVKHGEESVMVWSCLTTFSDLEDLLSSMKL